jgi:hypothetical protein
MMKRVEMPALLSLARERTLPVAEPLASLLPDGALQRGRAIGCQGRAASSVALALAAAAVDAGAWAATVDLPHLGLEAATELGIPLERLVRVDCGDRREQDTTAWAEVVAAVIDGFEIVITAPPARISAGLLRRVQARVQNRGAVLLVVGDSTSVPVDVVIRTTSSTWEGADTGHGYLHARRLGVESTGRRIPRPRRGDLWLPGPGGALGATAPDAHDLGLDEAVELRSAG